MKLTAIILLSACLTASANGISQTITLNVKDAPLEKVFTEIAKQSGYQFFFNERLLKDAKKVTIDLENASLHQALEACFKDQPFSYVIVEKTVVVKKKDHSTGSELPNDKTTNINLPAPIDITGKITNAQGEPLSGASIIIKRTGKGDIAGANGIFKLNNVNADDIIEISYTGYKTQSIKVGDRTNFTLAILPVVNLWDVLP